MSYSTKTAIAAIGPYERQNDREAQTYIRASYRCLSKERQVKYFMIILSFFVCLCGIFNKYLPVIFRSFDKTTVQKVQEQISTYINLASGIVMIINLLLAFYTHRMHVEGVVLQECFDCYVFGLARNQAALRPISQTMIDIYSSKIKRHSERFCNLYYQSEDDYDPETCHFDNINRQFRSDQRLYMSVQTFFLSIWLGFCIIIFVLALSFNDDFVHTLINIMFPSMSAITIIVNSWFNFRQQLRQMTNAINEIDTILRLNDKARKAKMCDPFVLRCLQDALFNFRTSPFVIPSFLVRRHEKKLAKESWGNGVRKSSDLILAIKDNAAHTKDRMKTNYRDVGVSTHMLSDVKNPPYTQQNLFLPETSVIETAATVSSAKGKSAKTRAQKTETLQTLTSQNAPEKSSTVATQKSPTQKTAPTQKAAVTQKAATSQKNITTQHNAAQKSVPTKNSKRK